MAGPIVIPQPVIYKDPLITKQAWWRRKPKEGDKCISCGINWATDAGANNAVSIDCSQAGTVQFSQICALFVDNLGSDSDVTFVFPDTQFELTIPARGEGLWPVQTNSLSFYVLGAAPGPNDVTYFQIYNSLPPPVSVMKSSDFLTPAGANVLAMATGTTSVVPAPTAGIIAGLDISAGNVLGGAAGGNLQVELTQGVSAPVIWGTNFGMQAAGFASYIKLLSLSNLNIPFKNGLNIIQLFGGTAFASGVLWVDIYYR